MCRRFVNLRVTRVSSSKRASLDVNVIGSGILTRVLQAKMAVTLKFNDFWKLKFKLYNLKKYYNIIIVKQWTALKQEE